MNTEQYLLMKLAEECTEVAQIAMKCMAFGLQETQTGGDKTNAERLYGELNDILAHIRMLNDYTDGNFCFTPSEEAQNAKEAKVWHYYDYARSIGTVD